MKTVDEYAALAEQYAKVDYRVSIIYTQLAFLALAARNSPSKVSVEKTNDAS